MGFYVAEEVIWARNCSNPFEGKRRSPRGSKAAGIQYENLLGKILKPKVPFLHQGAWFEFGDRNGRHLCQPDFIFGFDSVLWVLEVKYSLVESGFLQMEQLYIPVLRKVYGKEVYGIQVCRNLGLSYSFSPRPRIMPSLDTAMHVAAGGKRSVWHWPGLSGVGAQLPALGNGSLDEVPEYAVA